MFLFRRETIRSALQKSGLKRAILRFKNEARIFQRVRTDLFAYHANHPVIRQTIRLRQTVLLARTLQSRVYVSRVIDRFQPAPFLNIYSSIFYLIRSTINSFFPAIASATNFTDNRSFQF